MEHHVNLQFSKFNWKLLTSAIEIIIEITKFSGVASYDRRSLISLIIVCDWNWQTRAAYEV